MRARRFSMSGMSPRWIRRTTYRRPRSRAVSRRSRWENVYVEWVDRDPDLEASYAYGIPTAFRHVGDIIRGERDVRHDAGVHGERQCLRRGPVPTERSYSTAASLPIPSCRLTVGFTQITYSPVPGPDLICGGSHEEALRRHRPTTR